jgi:hypothetical protein
MNWVPNCLRCVCTSIFWMRGVHGTKELIKALIQSTYIRFRGARLHVATAADACMWMKLNRRWLSRTWWDFRMMKSKGFFVEVICVFPWTWSTSGPVCSRSHVLELVTGVISFGLISSPARLLYASNCCIRDFIITKSPRKSTTSVTHDRYTQLSKLTSCNITAPARETGRTTNKSLYCGVNWTRTSLSFNFPVCWKLKSSLKQIHLLYY